MKTNVPIESHPDAPEGSVATLDSYLPSDFPPTCAILCRCTAPLVSFALDLLSYNVACTIAGRDLAAGLTSLVDRMRATDMRDFRVKLDQHRKEEFNRLRAKGKIAQAEAYNDKLHALQIIACDCAAPADIKAKIEQLFRAGPGVCLSTIHKAKGREWELVYILDFDELMPGPWASEAELPQEYNLIYVAQTRARLHLRYINSNCWKK